MSPHRVILASSLLLLACFVAIARSGPDGDIADSSTGKLEQLEARIAALEARVVQLEQTQPPVFRTPQQPPSIVPRPPALRDVLPGWQEREVNGMRFYIVPLDSNAVGRISNPSEQQQP